MQAPGTQVGTDDDMQSPHVTCIGEQDISHANKVVTQLPKLRIYLLFQCSVFMMIVMEM